MPSSIKNSERQKILHLYRLLLRPRRIEERMLNLLRQNRISKWFSGIGQEAIAVGATLAMHRDDYILPMHRNLGVFTTRDVDLYKLFCQLMGKADGFTGGRERSFHFGIPEYRIIGMISHLAAMMPVADGLALASKLKKEDMVALSFTGDGASSEGDFHEAINLAAVWKLPVIFLIENNGYGLSTPVNEQYACERLVDRARGYGIDGVRIDGNDIREVHKTISGLRKQVAVTNRPVLVEAMTFRMRGHEEASGTAYVPGDLFEEWGKKDPILRVEQLLEDKYKMSDDEKEQIRKEVDNWFTPALEKALDAPYPEPDTSREEQKVYSPFYNLKSEETTTNGKQVNRRYIDAVTAALQQAMDEDESVLIMGQDIAEYGGVFKVTQGFAEKYGTDRVRNTPIVESSAIGVAYGLALLELKPVVEMQFADFITCGYNQIVNNLSRSHYRWSPPVNVTIRCPYGGGVGAGPFHSESPESWFMMHAGLKIVCPATVEDAQILTYSALLDPNPVLVFEHKRLYRSLKGDVPEHIEAEELGRAQVLREGTDATIITYGMGVQWAIEAASKWQDEDVELEIVDLRTVLPMDLEKVRSSLQKTNRALLLQEASLTMGPMSEMAALISEHCFEYLDAPVMRCASLDTPIPTAKTLEDDYLATSRLDGVIRKLLDY